MENENILLKIYREYTQDEAINVLKQEIASLNFKIGELNSEKAEHNWVSLQDTKEQRIKRAEEGVNKSFEKKIAKLENTISILRKEKITYLPKYINMKNESIFTKGIPQCPFCKEPTKREPTGVNTVTTTFYPPSYDEEGNNTNPDRNDRTKCWKCLKCEQIYTVVGNETDGFKSS